MFLFFFRKKITIVQLKDEVRKRKLERWTWLFAQGEDLDPDNLPDFMKTPEMGQTMETIQQFSEREESYHLYQRRVNYYRQQRAIQEDVDRYKKEKQEALKREKAALKREKITEQEKKLALKREKSNEQEKKLALKEKQEALKREKATEKEKKVLEEKVKKMELELN